MAILHNLMNGWKNQHQHLREGSLNDYNIDDQKKKKKERKKREIWSLLIYYYFALHIRIFNDTFSNFLTISHRSTTDHVYLVYTNQ